MKIICITFEETTSEEVIVMPPRGSPVAHVPPRRVQPKMRSHLKECLNITTDFFCGIHTEKLGIGGRTADLNSLQMSSWLAHRAVWAACLLFEEDEFLIFDEWAQFQPDWRELLHSARADLPYTWNIFLLGQSTVAYLVRRRALQQMIDTQDACGPVAPIAQTLAACTWPVIGGVYTALPRIIK
jgi:hypothetical protein